MVVQACYALAERSANQQVQLAEEQIQAAAAAALQPVLAASFGQTDTALAQQQDLCKVANCITGSLLPQVSSLFDNAIECVQNAFASMFTAASLPRLASLPKHERQIELKQLADITLGKPALQCKCVTQ